MPDRPMNFSPVPCARSCAVTGGGGDCDKGARQCRLTYDRKDLAIQALARSATISDLSTRHRVSRKVIYAQPGECHVITGAALTPLDGGERLRSGRPLYHRRAPRRLRGAHPRVLQQLRASLPAIVAIRHAGESYAITAALRVGHAPDCLDVGACRRCSRKGGKLHLVSDHRQVTRGAESI
jgi:hypothetical protein